MLIVKKRTNPDGRVDEQDDDEPRAKLSRKGMTKSNTETAS